jgi:stearoyl-CoA desaturase (delta-9 desaturase)
MTSTLERTAPPAVVPDGSAVGRNDEDAAVEQPPSTVAKVATALIVGIPVAALLASVVVLWGNGIHLRDVVIAVALYALTGHGVTRGFHRLLAHKAFTANRPLKLVLVTLGSMAYQGAPIGWVANHRGHHVLADTVADPHSPQHHSSRPLGRVKGLCAPIRTSFG